MRRSVLLVAVAGWVSGYWWCRGRWEHELWFWYFLLPVLLWNGKELVNFWKDTLRGSSEEKWWWILFLGVVEWQFWVTGFREGVWWDGPGAARDGLMVFIVASGLALIAKNAEDTRWLWRAVFWIGTGAIAASLVRFYGRVGIDEERFRFCWRSWPGFNAVTTGILCGLVGVVGLGERDANRSWIWRVSMMVVGFGLAASESRGALLAVLAGGCYWLWRNRENWVGIVFPLSGFVTYWILVLMQSGGSGGMVERGSAGRTLIYEVYLKRMAGWEWVVGKGVVEALPPEILGWEVHHPHSAYLGQLIGYGMVGLLLMMGAMAWRWWGMRNEREAVVLVFGAVAIMFDGGMVFSLMAVARWEALVVLVPLVVGRRRA